ncbi:MAG: hypothetical protein P8P74_05180 [Crocinitomicaceae bacterium]|nr:hypothetical protein [Crocinitomicaceae bacterium]
MSFPAVMAFLAILDHSPYSIWLAWGGWLFMILYVLFTIVFRNRSIERNEPATRRNTTIQLIIRLILLLIVPGQLSLDTVQNYFYASTAGAGLSIVVALFIAFIHKAYKDLESTKEFGIGLLVMVLCFIGLTTYPFVAEIVRYFGEKDTSSILYLIAIFVFEFSSVYLIFARHIKSGDSQIGPDMKSDKAIIVIVLGWILGFGILAAVMTHRAKSIPSEQNPIQLEVHSDSLFLLN